LQVGQAGRWSAEHRVRALRNDEAYARLVDRRLLIGEVHDPRRHDRGDEQDRPLAHPEDAEVVTQLERARARRWGLGLHHGAPGRSPPGWELAWAFRAGCACTCARRLPLRSRGVTEGDLTQWDVVERAFREFEPEAIVHYGEMPSAPYSMIDREHAIFTQHNNVENTMNVLWAMRDLAPNAHLVKLGTMGEYGTPN